MKTFWKLFVATTLLSSATLFAQSPLARSIGTNDYTTDLATVNDAQSQALNQAREMLKDTENPAQRKALTAAIKEMERAQTALADAKNSPQKLPVAVSAQQAAYQALLKLIPRETSVTRARGQGQGGNQRDQQQLDQLEMKDEANRYETERQAATPQTEKQREQSATANRLKELAQRQQDLNERLRELQTALQAARTEQEREDIQRQLKRLRDEQRQMLADLDELRQQMDRSPNASQNAETRQQLEQTRSDMQRATEQLDQNSPSQALASGTRAEQNLQNARENLRKQSSSQFSEQMRDLRNRARDLARKEEDVARELDSLQNAEHKSLDNSVERQQLTEQMNKQQNALTNLLAGMRAVTEQSENIEPLLSKQLYDTLRRADQMRAENLLQMSSQLMQRGFLPQAGDAERAARTNINQIRASVEQAAQSVLGNEAEALRYAQKELDELTRQVQREISQSQSNQLAQAGARGGNGTNSVSASDRGLNSQTNSSALAQNGNRGRQNQSENQSKQQSASSENSQGQGGQRQQGSNQNEQANNASGQSGNGQNQNPFDSQQNAQGNGRGNSDLDQLRQLAQQLGRGGGNGGDRGGPITGGDFVNWSDRLRDVERVLDSPDLRNQLTTVRERMAAYRADFRQRGRVPDDRVLQDQILAPMTQVRVWLQQELARQENANSLVPLDRDPVPDNYSELVREYYEKLGSAK